MGFLKQELPSELKAFGEVFDSLGYQYSYNDLFYDFIDYTIACFLVDGDKEVAERLERKYGKNYPIFYKLFGAMLEALNVIFDKKKWFDMLGLIYEIITSKWKSSAMGQFFTPDTIVDLMVTIVNPIAGAKQAVLDCACGSGRMLLASHVHAPGNYQFAADLDPVCTKMTAINMLLHGCVGEVSCMDSISYTWHFGYEVNSSLKKYGIPSLKRVPHFSESIFYSNPRPLTKVEMVEKTVQKGIQLTLF